MSLCPVLAVALLLLSSIANVPPTVVEKFLEENPSFRLLQIADVRDLIEPVGEEQFSPFVQSELTGDRFEDVAAVVVQRGSHLRYGVVAFNGSRSGYGHPQWIMQPQPKRIVGVYLKNRRRIDIALCLACDSNSFVRWDGAEYAENFWLPGDTPMTFDQLSRGVTPVALFTSPSRASRIAAQLPQCTEAEIIRSLKRGAAGDRWYKVAVTLNGRRQVGFVHGGALTEVSCVG